MQQVPGIKPMEVYYPEIVTNEVDEICAVYTAANGMQFGDPVAELGNAITAKLPSGGMVGGRAPMSETETPVVRPHCLVEDINKAVAEAEKAGAMIAMEPTEISGYGVFAIYIIGEVEHSLWQR